MEAPRSSLSSSIFDRADHWFVRAKAALLGNVPCGKGCCHCCIGPFPITVLDAEELRRGLRELPAVQRQNIEGRARRQTADIETACPDLAADPILDGLPDQKIDDLVARFADQPCPALEKDGSCALYSFRPITCRTMGIPTETHGMVYGACDIQSSVPVIRLSRLLRTEEDRLADQEAGLIETEKRRRSFTGEELLLPYGFLPGFE
ncbi:YkgJ family cysteine cluster protein [Nitrospira sp. Nam80]